MRKVEDNNKNDNRKKRPQGQRSPQAARELNLPGIRKLRNLNLRKHSEHIWRDTGGGDVYSSASEDEDHPERNVTQTGGPFLSTLHRYIPRTRRNCPIPRFLSPRGEQFIDDGSATSARKHPSSFRSRVGVTPFPDTKSSTRDLDKRSSKISGWLRPSESHQTPKSVPSRTTSITRKTQSESVIPDTKSSKSVQPPLPYYSLPDKKSSEFAAVSERKRSLPNFQSSSATVAKKQQSQRSVHPEVSSSRNLHSDASSASLAAKPPVPLPRRSLILKKSLHKEVSEDTESSTLETEPVRPVAKPRSQRLKVPKSSEKIEEVSTSQMKFEESADDASSTEDTSEVPRFYIEFDPSLVFHDDSSPLDTETMSQTKSTTCDPCQGYALPRHRRIPPHLRYQQEIQPRYTEEPMFWAKSRWARMRGCEDPTLWPPDPKRYPIPDHILNNALRVVREPKRRPIPRYQDSTGKVSNWCSSGLARNYIYKPDYGKVPAYLQSSRREPQGLRPDEFGSIMNMCLPSEFFEKCFPKS